MEKDFQTDRNSKPNSASTSLSSKNQKGMDISIQSRPNPTQSRSARFPLTSKLTINILYLRSLRPCQPSTMSCKIIQTTITLPSFRTPSSPINCHSSAILPESARSRQRIRHTETSSASAHLKRSQPKFMCKVGRYSS